MAGFLRRKNKQPATVNVVADTTTTTTTTTKAKGGTPPLFARFATTATKSTDDVPRIVSSPMSLAASNRVGGSGGASALEGGNRRKSHSQVAGNDQRGIVVTVPSAKPAPSRAPSLPNQSTYSLHSNAQRAAGAARPPGPPPTYTTQHSAARAWRSSLVGLEDKPLPPPNGNVGTSPPPSSPPPPTRSLPLPPSSQSQSPQQSLNRPGLSAYTHNASFNASSQTLAPHASGSRLDTSDLRVSSRSSGLEKEKEMEGSEGTSWGELAPEFAMFQVSFRLHLWSPYAAFFPSPFPLVHLFWLLG